jgi:hypothetical protein
MMVPLWFTIPFAAIGLVVSIFYAVNAYTIFGAKKPTNTPGQIHQFWFNFLGSILGWVAFWFLIRKIWHCLSVDCPGEFGASTVMLAAVAFVGVTGHLPYATAGVLEGLKVLALKLAGLAE